MGSICPQHGRRLAEECEPQVNVGWDDDQRHGLQVGHRRQAGTHLIDGMHVEHDQVGRVAGGRHPGSVEFAPPSIP
jgi:hypothetical protein